VNWPKLPAEVNGLAGPIRILRPVQMKDKDQTGEWDQEARVIRIKGTLTREAAWHTLLHELAHAAVDEAGVTLPKRFEEPVAESVASGMLHVVRLLLTQRAVDGT
jgi:Zn-dependent peptidase ImmA (M78 family)